VNLNFTCTQFRLSLSCCCLFFAWLYAIGSPHSLIGH
jgi:hypothetical protein